MTQNVIHFKDNRPRGKPFSVGPDPRRHMNGPSKGVNPLILLKKRALEKHTEDIMDIIFIVINQAKQGNEKSQALVFDKFVTSVLADLSADNCEDISVLEGISNIPKEVLEEMKSNIVNQMIKYSDNDNKEIVGD